MKVRFEWDTDKAAANLRKHKIGFDEACTVFGDPLANVFDDENHSTEEAREIIIGHSTNHVLLVCFTEHTQDVIRIYSARRASSTERKEYEENLSR